MKNYLALLRGINVGGKNLIKMKNLVECFQALGFENVRTYIQSGNVIFSTEKASPAELERSIEEALSSTFPFYTASVVLRSDAELKAIVANAPNGFGGDPDNYRSDVIFLKRPLTASEAMKQVMIKEGVDQAFAGKDVLYFSRLISRASSSYLSRIVGLPVYQNMTIRNWNTTTKLVSLLHPEK